MSEVIGSGIKSDAEVKKLYDGFKVKDMPFEEFKKEYRNLTDPASMSNDLSVIMAQKRGKL